MGSGFGQAVGDLIIREFAAIFGAGFVAGAVVAWLVNWLVL